MILRIPVSASTVFVLALSASSVLTVATFPVPALVVLAHPTTRPENQVDSSPQGRAHRALPTGAEDRAAEAPAAAPTAPAITAAFMAA